VEKKIFVYDLEIIKAIPPKNEKDRKKGIEYCKGWDDHAGMGISVLCGFDYLENRYRVIGETNKADFQKYIDDNYLMVTFNGINFDDKVIKACWGQDVPSELQYDLLVAIWAADGLGPKFNYKTHGGYGLDDCCSKNFGTTKTGHGALAPVDWQQGRIFEVIDYCINDVKMTRQLLEQVIMKQYIVHPKREGNLAVPNDLLVKYGNK